MITEERKERIDWIDSAKAISIVLVIIGHTSWGLKNSVNFSWVYGVHLVMFFLIAGYLFKKRELTKEYVNNKFARLMAPYFITCICILCTDVFHSYLFHHDSTLLTVTQIVFQDLVRSFFASGHISNFGTVNIGTRIGAIWFLPAMFFATIGFQYLVHYTEDSYKQCCLTCVLGAVGFMSGRFLWLPFSIQSAMLSLFFVWTGFEIRKRNILSRVRAWHYLLALIIFIWGARNHFADVGFVVANMSDVIISPLVGIAGCLLIYGCARVTSSSRVLAYIGRNSLLVLCTHLYAIETLYPYVHKTLDILKLEGNQRGWAVIIIEVVFAITLATFIDVFSHYLQTKRSGHVRMFLDDNNRNVEIDIIRGLLVYSMLVGSFAVDSGLRNVIFSCHAPAFVFLSGYFYKKDVKSGHILRSLLLPYAIFVASKLVLDLCLLNASFSIKELAVSLRNYCLGMSFSKNLLSEIPSVGPVYFILMLFVVRVTYKLFDLFFTNELQKHFVVLICSLVGVYCGRKGYWLPWSFDVACYCIIFYHLGYLCRYYCVRAAVDFLPSYFLCSSLWAYMVYCDRFEIAVRKYGQYGVSVLGCVAGILCVWMLASYFTKHNYCLSCLLAATGRNAMLFLLVHSLFQDLLNQYISLWCHPKGFLLMACSVAVQAAIVFVIGFLSDKVKLYWLHRV